MKYLNILFGLFLVTSCCSAKTATQEITEITIEAPSDVVTTEESMKEISSKDSKIVITEEVIGVEMPGLITSSTLNHSSWNLLLQKHVSEEGNVNYKGFKTDRSALNDYIKTLSENVPTDDWSSKEKLAYWINTYNALTVDLIVQNYPIKSIKDIKDPWKQRLWKLGNKWYDLDEIEHQIIRKMGEPRIHFALVCAAKSCPKLYNKAFTADNLEESLSELTREFLSDTSKNEISENRLKLSKIFKWFAKDFKENGTLIDFLNLYSDVTIAQNAKISYTTYNWELNE